MAQKPLDPIERFMRHVQVTDLCWNWTGHTAGSKSTYGYFRVTTKSTDPKMLAHRYAYMVFIGEIPAGHEIDHLCRNTLCVNPAHLEPVLPAENSRRARKHVCKFGHDLTIEANCYFDNKGRRRGCGICPSQRYHRAKALKG